MALRWEDDTPRAAPSVHPFAWLIVITLSLALWCLIALLVLTLVHVT